MHRCAVPPATNQTKSKESYSFMKTRIFILALSALTLGSSIPARADDPQARNLRALQPPVATVQTVVVTTKMSDACQRRCADYQRKGYPTIACVERMAR